MIHCPYCGSEMSDEARFCPKCLSILTGEAEKYLPPALPRWLHPMTVFVAIALISTGLLAAGIAGKLGKKPVDTRTVVAGGGDDRKDKDVEDGGAAADKSPSLRPSLPGRETPGRSTESAVTEDYDEVSQYVAGVREIVKESETLGLEIEDLRQEKDKSKLPLVGEKLRKLQILTGKLANLKPPDSLRRAHTRLSSSFRVRQRGYKNIMYYMEQGDMKRLDKGKKDIETAEKTIERAIKQIEDLMEKVPPPPPPPPEEPEAAPAEEEPPAPAEPEKPPVEEKKPPVPEEEPGGPGPADGASDFVPEEGGTVFIEDGGTIYVEDGETLYPGDEGETYPEEGGEIYPEGGELPPELPY